jgi:hypothetical protein
VHDGEGDCFVFRYGAIDWSRGDDWGNGGVDGECGRIVHVGVERVGDFYCIGVSIGERGVGKCERCGGSVAEMVVIGDWLVVLELLERHRCGIGDGDGEGRRLIFGNGAVGRVRGDAWGRGLLEGFDAEL